MSKEVRIGNIIIGGTNHIAIQSMTNTKTSDFEETLQQIKRLQSAGCEIVRVAVTDEADAIAIKDLKKYVSCPIVADIHFDYKLALLSIENGADKIRINPGNIGSKDKVEKVVSACKKHHIPIRIGINSGSIEKELVEKYGGNTVDAMIESMTKYVKMIEDMGYYNLVLSIKATSIKDTITVNEILKKKFNYPIHIGLTESGTILKGAIKSSYPLGVLLEEGIGDTIRVSLNGDPVSEIEVCKEILAMHGKYDKPTLIACPTCGRCKYNIIPIVREMEQFLDTLNTPIKVAIMGCAVNGPGEARDADIGIAGGINEAILFKKGEIIRKIPENQIVQELKQEIYEMIKVTE